MTNSNAIEIISGVNQIKDRFRNLNEKYVHQILTNDIKLLNHCVKSF
jgi:hypothetical protein